MSNNGIINPAYDNDGTKGALLITPLAISSLDDKTCPICREPYQGKPLGNNGIVDTTLEEPVSVDLVAEWFGHKKCCGHIMGRKCLEIHLTTPGEWSNKCPICRDIWFHRSVPKDIADRLQRQTQTVRQTAEVTPRRSQRIARRAAVQRYASRAPIRIERNVRSAPERPTSFSQKLFTALEVKGGSTEVRGTLADVEGRLKRLYKAL